MTVKELKDILNTVDDNLPVIVSYYVNSEYGGYVHIKNEDVFVDDVRELVANGRYVDGNYTEHYENYRALRIDFEE